jgi:hypothetical protein
MPGSNRVCYVHTHTRQVAEVRVNPLKLKKQRAQLQRPPRNHYITDFLNRHTVSNSVCGGFVAADCLSDLNAFTGRFVFSEFFEATVLVEHADFEVEYGFADYAESEVTWLNYACVDGADCNVVDAFAVHLFELVLVFLVGFYCSDFAVLK